MRADDVGEWVDVLWSAIPLAIATLIFVAQVVWIEPNALLVGAGLTLLAGPKAREWDRKRRRHERTEAREGSWKSP